MKQSAPLGNYKAFGITRLAANKKTRKTDWQPWGPLGPGIMKVFQTSKIGYKATGMVFWGKKQKQKTQVLWFSKIVLKISLSKSSNKWTEKCITPFYKVGRLIERAVLSFIPLLSGDSQLQNPTKMQLGNVVLIFTVHQGPRFSVETVIALFLIFWGQKLEIVHLYLTRAWLMVSSNHYLRGKCH